MAAGDSYSDVKVGTASSSQWSSVGDNDHRQSPGGLISVSELFMAERSGPAQLGEARL